MFERWEKTLRNVGVRARLVTVGVLGFIAILLVGTLAHNAIEGFAFTGGDDVDAMPGNGKTQSTIAFGNKDKLPGGMSDEVTVYYMSHPDLYPGDTKGSKASNWARVSGQCYIEWQKPSDTFGQGISHYGGIAYKVTFPDGSSNTGYCADNYDEYSADGQVNPYQTILGDAGKVRTHGMFENVVTEITGTSTVDASHPVVNDGNQHWVPKNGVYTFYGILKLPEDGTAINDNGTNNYAYHVLINSKVAATDETIDLNAEKEHLIYWDYFHVDTDAEAETYLNDPSNGLRENGKATGYTQNLASEWQIGATGTTSIELNKSTSNSSINFVSSENSPYSFTNITYDLYEDGSVQNGSLVDGAEPIRTTKLDANGTGKFTGLKINTKYWYRERPDSVAGTGYKADGELHPVTTSGVEGTQSSVTTEPVKDEPLSIEFVLQKTDSMGKADKGFGATVDGTNGLEGAQFEVTYYNGYFRTKEEAEKSGAASRTWLLKSKNETIDGNTVAMVRLDKDHLVNNEDPKDVFYYAQDGTTPVIPLGTVFVQEKVAPDHYLFENLTPKEADALDGEKLEDKYAAPVHVAQIREQDGKAFYDLSMDGADGAQWSKDHVSAADLAIKNNPDDLAIKTEIGVGTPVWNNDNNVPWDSEDSHVVNRTVENGADSYKLTDSLIVSAHMDNNGNSILNKKGEPEDQQPTFTVVGEIHRARVTGVDNRYTDDFSHAEYVDEGAVPLIEGTSGWVAEGQTQAIVSNVHAAGGNLSQALIKTVVNMCVPSSEAVLGTKLVAFERVYKGNVTLDQVNNNEAELLTEHVDLYDNNQSLFVPGLMTLFADMSSKQSILVTGHLSLTDHVAYMALDPNKSYTVEGRLVYDDGTEVLDANGQPVTSTGKLSDDHGMFGTQDLQFDAEIPADEMSKHNGIIAFEKLYEKTYKDKKATNVLVSKHESLEDKDQTVTIVLSPKVLTTATDSETGTHVGTPAAAVINDRVSLSNLVVGGTYTVKGRAVLKSTGEYLRTDGTTTSNPDEALVESKEFTADAASMTVDLQFPIDMTGHADDSAVIFEELFAKGDDGNYPDVPTAEHNDINDEDQTVDYPGKPTVKTEAVDSQTGTHTGTPASDTVVKDHVTISGLTVGDTYTVKGRAVLKSTGDYLKSDGSTTKDKDDALVVTSEPIKATDKTMTVDLEFKIDMSGHAGDAVVIFEQLFHGSEETPVAEHNDINDKDQTVDYPGKPTVKTEAVDSQTGTHTGTPASDTVVKDHVTLSGLTVGDTYTVKGRAVLKSTGDYLKSDGTTTKNANEALIVTSEPIKATDKTMTVDLEFKIDMSGHAGDAVVIFEQLFHGNEETPVAEHNDINDKDQTVDYPANPTVSTTLEHEKTGHTVRPSGTTKLTDHVTYTGLVPGKKYKLSGVLMDKESAKPMMQEGKEIAVEIEFTPKSASGAQDITFELDFSKLDEDAEGHAAVAFETITDVETNTEVADHKDIDDEDQTVHFPKIRTTATADESGTHTAHVTSKVNVTDVVKYTSLAPGKEYVIQASVHVRGADGKDLGIFKNSKTGKELTDAIPFKPEKPNGNIKVFFSFWTSDPEEMFAGQTYVCFEKLYAGKDTNGLTDDRLVAVHENISDEEQSIHFPKIRTVATVDGSHTFMGNKSTVLVDKVTYSNLVVGEHYKMTGKLMDKATGKAITDPDGREITASQEFTAKSPNGVIEMTFKFDSTQMQGKSLVAFENLSVKGPDGKFHDVAKHSDIDDKAQTVSITPNPETPPMPQTGAGSAAVILLCIGIAAGAAALWQVASKRK